MGDAADDLFDSAMSEQEMRDCLDNACPCQPKAWRQTDDGLYECQSCGEVVDL